MTKKRKRSEEAIARRKEKRLRKVFIALPKTKAECKRWKPPAEEIVPSSPLVVKDLQEGVLIRTFPNSIATELMDTLGTSTDQLIKSYPPPADRTCRGKQNCYYFGHWRKYTSDITKTLHTVHEAFQVWYQHNTPLFQFLSNLLEKTFPSLYKQYMDRVDEEYRLFGAWSFAVVNVNSPSTFHKDTADWSHGFCVVVAFGEYQGGELCFPSCNVNVELRMGDAIFFQSHSLTHGNLPVTGTRHSLVLTSHNTLFNMKAK